MSEIRRITWNAPRLPEKRPEQSHWSTWYDGSAGMWVLEKDEEETMRATDPEKIMNHLREAASDGDTCEGLPVWFAYQDDPWQVWSEDY